MAGFVDTTTHVVFVDTITNPQCSYFLTVVPSISRWIDFNHYLINNIYMFFFFQKVHIVNNNQ